MKKGLKIGAAVLCAALMAGSLTACSGPKSAGKAYLKAVDSYTFWENDLSQAIPQPNVGQMVQEFLDAKSTDGKKKKVAFIGYDGCRAEALIHALKSGATDKSKGDYSGSKEGDSLHSALGKMKAEGAKLYLSHAGGYKGEDTQQHTSTAPGWTTMMTGAWGKDNGITDNNMEKKIDYKSFMLKAAENQGMKTTFASSWSTHFEYSYKDEINYLKEHPSIPMTYQKVDDDTALHSYLMDCVTVGSPNEKDIIFGIYEATDHNGHSTGFGNQNYKYVDGFRDEDTMIYDLLNAIQNRSTYNQEDWLIILTTDHGGLGLSHGGQSSEERTTWICCNKPIDQKYYSQGYDGYNLKK